MLLSRFHGSRNRGMDTLFRDMTTNLLLVFICVAFVLLVFINVSKKAEQKKDAQPVGNVCVTIAWDHGDYDVDEWFKPPNDVPVGYSNLGSKYGNLMRDDLGTPDPELNFETACTRGIPAGEYVANVHWYASHGPAKEVRVRADVRVTSSLLGEGKGNSKVILQTNAFLSHVGQELTLFRFTLTEKGELVPGSVHSIFMPLRSYSPGTSWPTENHEGGAL